MNFKKISKSIEELILEYHKISEIELAGLYWEEIFNKSLLKENFKTDWELGSHASGKDIGILNSPYSFSLKSGKISKKGILTFSGSRTGKYPLLEEKLNFFDGECKNFSHYLFLAKTDLKYKVILIKGDDISSKKLNWYKHKNGKDWIGEENGGISMAIRHSLSHQFWIKIDLEKFKKYNILMKMKR